CQNYDSSPLTF
nr:immunoglobulin light chain junction region [Macaca mulatta]